MCDATGGVIYVGNETAARGPASAMLASNIKAVVNCTDDMPNYCEVPATHAPHPMADAPRVRYHRFNVAYWQAAGAQHAEQRTSDASVLAFVRGLFAFVDDALANGESVLVHCLAGAHRAGTTGCLLLMHKMALGAADSVKAAKSLRPVINPIGSLPGVLRFFEQARADEQHQQPAARAGAGGGGVDLTAGPRPTG